MHTQYFTKLELTIIVTRAMQPVATRSQSPYISISQLVSHYDVILIMTSRAFRRMTSYSLWRHSLLSRPRPLLRTYERTYVRTPYRV